jgi:hypothetical protein
MIQLIFILAPGSKFWKNLTSVLAVNDDMLHVRYQYTGRTNQDLA